MKPEAFIALSSDTREIRPYRRACDLAGAVKGFPKAAPRARGLFWKMRCDGEIEVLRTVLRSVDCVPGTEDSHISCDTYVARHDFPPARHKTPDAGRHREDGSEFGGPAKSCKPLRAVAPHSGKVPVLYEPEKKRLQAVSRVLEHAADAMPLSGQKEI
jgi:hypothetical protein